MWHAITLNRDPVIEMSNILRFRLHPDDSRHVGVPGLLKKCVCHIHDVGILGFFQIVG